MKIPAPSISSNPNPNPNPNLNPSPNPNQDYTLNKLEFAYYTQPMSLTHLTPIRAGPSAGGSSVTVHGTRLAASSLSPSLSPSPGPGPDPNPGGGSNQARASPPLPAGARRPAQHAADGTARK